MHTSIASNRCSPLVHSNPARQEYDLENLAGGVVQSLNGLFISLKEDMERKDMKLALLERDVQKQQSRSSRYKKQTEDKTSFIEQLEERQVQFQEQLSTANQQLEVRSEKASKLEEKCRQYKEYLNSAIAEQQSLYKASRAKCEDAIKQMQEAEQKKKVANEQERRKVEATREHFSQIVKSTVAEYKSKERECKCYLLNSYARELMSQSPLQSIF